MAPGAPTASEAQQTQNFSSPRVPPLRLTPGDLIGHLNTELSHVTTVSGVTWELLSLFQAILSPAYRKTHGGNFSELLGFGSDFSSP